MLFRFLKANSGATAIEYALIATLIGVALFFGVGSAGNQVTQLWNNNSDHLQDAID